MSTRELVECVFLLSCCHLIIVCLSDQAHLLFYTNEDFLSRGFIERPFAVLNHELLEELSKFMTSDISLLDGVRDGDTLLEWDSLSDSMT